MGQSCAFNRFIAVFNTAILSAATGFCFAIPIQAASAVTTPSEPSSSLESEDDGGSQRINMSAKLRALSQRIPAISCALAHSDNSEVMAPRLDIATKKFDRIIAALRIGDEGLGIIGVEKSPRILRALDNLVAQWEPFQKASQDLLADSTNAEVEMYIAKNNMKVLGLAKVASSEILGKYSNPVEVTAAEAMLINYSGRQRALTQKIAKESCGVVSGVAAFGSVEAMNKTISTFEATHMALSNGMPNAGIVQPPNDEIRLSLEQAASKWQEIKQISDTIVGIGSIDGDALENLFVLLNNERIQMNKVTGLYSAYAKATK